MPATEHGLLGRESELAALDRLIGDAARGRGRVVALRGEPGIGKTRLAREALSRCERRGFELFAAAAEEMERRRPFGVVSDALGVDRAHDRERAEIRALLRGGGMAGGGVLAESPVLESRVAELVLEHVEGLCARHRVALLLEDLHWADPSSLLALHRLARAAGELGCSSSALCGRTRSGASCARCSPPSSASGRLGSSSRRSTPERWARWSSGWRGRPRAPPSGGGWRPWAGT